MVLFWKKSKEEKLAEQGDKNAILKLIEQGKKEQAIRILENFKENPELLPILYKLYLEDGKYYYAYQLIEHYNKDLATAKERALIYERVGEKEKAVNEYLKIGDFESLKKAADLLYQLENKEKALEVYQRALNVAPALEKEKIQTDIQSIKQELGLVEIKKESFLEKIRKGLKKTKETIEFGIIFRGRKVDDELFEEIEEKLIRADVGAKLAVKLTEELKKEAIRKNIQKSEDLRQILSDMLLSLIRDCEGKLKDPDETPSVYLFLGVNGSGKTTTIGKLAYKFKSENKKVLLCAADTFRAAAIEQLEVWSQRSGVDIVKKHEGADPASVVYQAMEKAINESYHVVLIDTAGRLHTKEPLIRELRKIKSSIQKFKQNQPLETLLVLDATIGQNSISQAKVFGEAIDVSGIILTKLDGTSKGGAIVPICQELKIPIKLIGVGEKIDDLQPFSADIFIKELLS